MHVLEKTEDPAWDNSGVERMLLSSEKYNVVTATRPVLSRASFCGYT